MRNQSTSIIQYCTLYCVYCVGCVGAFAVCLAAAGCEEQAAKPEVTPEEVAKPKPPEPKVELPPAPAIASPPDSFPPMIVPDDNPTTPEKAALGELLFFDTRLSDGGKFACVTCHLPEKGWTDGEKLSTKHDGNANKRHSPTMYMVPYAQAWYWDGRKETLEAQILAAWTGQVGGTPKTVVENLAKVPAYEAHFQRAFGEGPSEGNIPQALAAFVRARFSVSTSAWDRYEAGDKKAVSADAAKGYKVFNKIGCSACHAPPLFTDMAYHNTGVGYEGADEPDLGRGAHTKEKTDAGKFKTPTLRGVALSAPYFHDGSADTLEDAVKFMAGGGYKKKNKNIDKLLEKHKLKKKDLARLMAFLQSLTPDAVAEYEPPKLP